MLYLTFDSNIWIYLLDASWNAKNPLDHLEFWISQRSVQIVLPEIIPIEWAKHREKEKESRQNKLQDFFRMAEDIIPSGFLESQRKPENIASIVESQFLRIDAMINSAIILPVSEELKIKVFDWGILKKAPMHRKTSVADAIIVFSLFDFAAGKTTDRFIFVTNNTEDFFAPDKRSIHQDLEPYFTKHNISYSKNLGHVVQDILAIFPVTIDLNEARKQRLQFRINQQIYNPSLIKSLKDTKDSVVENKGMIDLILKNKVPTTEQVLMIWGLIVSDVSYRNYFYNLVSSSAWFNLLKERGEFNSGQNPAPVEVERGFQVPYWPVLTYLNKLASEIPAGKHPELIPELIGILDDCSNHPQDNYTTWYHLLNILDRLPNESIPLSLFDHVPLWLGGRFQNSTSSSVLCERILPKFLNDQPTPDDLAKGLKILGYLTELRSVNPPDLYSRGGRSSKLISVTDLHQLSAALNNEQLLRRLTAYAGDQPFLDLGHKIYSLLYHFPNGIHATFNLNTVKIRVVYRFVNGAFKVSVFEDGQEEQEEHLLIPDLQFIPLEDLLNKVQHYLQEKAAGYKQEDVFEDPLTRLRFLMTTDFSNSFTLGHTPIFELEKKRGEDTFDVYVTVFRDWLGCIVAEQPDRGIALVRLLFNDPRFKAPVFKRIALYIIAKKWTHLRSFFVELISPTDPMHLFSIQYYRKELYSLLDEVQKDLADDEIALIANILDHGDQEKEEDDPDRWRHFWVAALRHTVPFKADYEKLSLKFDFTHEHFLQLGKVRMSGVTESPISVNELLKKDNGAIAEFIAEFRRDKDSDFTVSGVARELGKAIQAQPSRFADDLDRFIGIPYVYAKEFLTGFKNAWHDGLYFDWHKVMGFAVDYVRNENFGSTSLAVEDDNNRTTADWVADAIAELLSEGFANKKMSFDLSVLPMAKDLLLLLIDRFQNDVRPELNGFNYPQYLINSTTGKLLKALLDYSLFRFNSTESNDEVIKWEPEVRAALDSVISDKIFDSLIALGMYFDYFFFFDREWTLSIVKNILTFDENEVFTFLGGFAFSAAPRNSELYYLFYPFYLKAIERPELTDHDLLQALSRHYVAFYFYGLEDLVDGGLLFTILKSDPPERVAEILRFIWQQHDYVNNLNELEKPVFERRMIELWSFVNSRFTLPIGDEEEKVAAGLVHLLEFVSVLTEEVKDLIIATEIWSEKYYHTHELIEGLQRLSETGDPTDTANFLGQILIKLPVKVYLTDNEQTPLSMMIRFLYENGQKDVADEFCNQLSRAGHDFTISIYREFNDHS